MAGCATQSGVASVSLASPLPTPTVEATVSPSLHPVKSEDYGEFSSDRGVVRLTAESDGALSGSYPDGVLTCPPPSGVHVACTWYEGSNDGHAAFVRKDDGSLEGTWGSGESTDDGGEWTLVPLARGAGLSGAWHTNWGIAHLTDTGHGIHVDYARGTMDCALHGAQGLDCNWTEGSQSGKADLVIESQSVLRGTWGNGTSPSDGGAWILVRH
jgi:hypothetical protein